MEDENKPVDNPQQPVDNSQQPVDNSQQPVDNSQQPVDNSQQPVDNSQQPVDNSKEADESFDAKKYLESLEPDEDKPDLKAVMQENDLLKKQLAAVKDAYLSIKKTGVTVLSTPQSQPANTPNVDTTTQAADEMLKKWLHG